MAGRPTTYTEELADLICDRIAGDESLESICREDDMPGSSTVRQWLRKHPTFAANYARAREEQGHTAADTLSDIRKQILRGEIAPDVGRAVADITKWESARRAPKHYGDKITTEHTGPDGGAIPHTVRHEVIDPKNAG